MNHAAVLASAAALALAAPLAAAHPPDEHGRHPPSANDTAHAHASMRLWTNTRTGETVRGAFLASREGRVSIERENGDVVVFALEDLAPADQAEVRTQAARVREINAAAAPAPAFAAPAGNTPAPAPPKPAGDAAAKPAQAGVFDRFAPFVSTRWDNAWLFVESDGLPHVPGGKPGTYICSHPLMVGITAWQQQVPLPQNYRGANAWQIPLKPEFADKPILAKDNFFRGAIALAANGVPIFNPIKNDGRTDTFLAGELDEFGGHCGRADDYHYHIAPTHLQKFVGKDAPIAYALDGFPIYGLFDPAAKPGGPDADKCCPLGGTEKLDELNGHSGAPPKDAPIGAKGPYHYHASVKYPYINGGMRGKVTVKDGQSDPQPRATSPRPALPPLRGATITGFKTVAENAWSIEYTLAGAKHLVNYRLEPNGAAVFDFVDPAGATRTERYEPRPDRDRPPRNNADQGDRPRRRNRDGGPDDRPPPPPPPGEPRDGPGPQRGPGGGKGNPVHPDSKAGSTGLKLSSPVVGADSRLPAEFTCDGAGISPPLLWASPPAGTQSFAITMHHIPGPPRPGDRPGEDKHVYLVAYNIPASTLALEKGKPRPGVLGVNTVNRRAEYAPPCSQGPGPKLYTITVYALSVPPTLKPEQERSAPGPTMDALLAAIKDHTIDSATLDVVYERPNQK
jgi:phosphatidylethanolamine-binding protein (PEBP) family uncharacterized protein